MLRNGDVLCLQKITWVLNCLSILDKETTYLLGFFIFLVFGKGKSGQEMYRACYCMLFLGVFAKWDLLLIVLICRGVGRLGSSWWVYLQGDRPFYIFVLIFFSSNKVEYIQFSTSTVDMQFEATSTKEFNRKILTHVPVLRCNARTLSTF